MRIENTMFSIIRSEICAKELNLDDLQNISFEEYGQMYELSHKHDMAHIIASALLRIGKLKNDEISAKFNKQLMTALFCDGQREYELAQLSKLLENAKIPHIMLKGAVIRSFYPKPWMRTSCDIDVLIQEKDTELAIKTLCSAGYKRIDDCSTHDYSFMSPNNLHIELHYTLTQEGQINSADAIFESVWEKYAVLSDNCNYRYELTPEVFILYHLAHMGRHLVDGGCGIRPFIDLWLIRRYINYNSEELNVLLNQAGLLTFYKTAVELGRVWLEANEHSEITRCLEMFILDGGVYGTSDNAAIVQAARGIGKIRSFMNIMFLPAKNLKVLYPILIKYPILIPFYQIKRWFRLFNKEKRQNIKRRVDTRNDVSQGEAESTAVLLQSIGLDR